jgi:hypothetical protein
VEGAVVEHVLQAGAELIRNRLARQAYPTLQLSRPRLLKTDDPINIHLNYFPVLP